jgi:hypothetical protein
MNATEAIDKIVKLLGLKFAKDKFFSTVLDDGTTEVTNNLDEELMVGQTLYVIGETTLSPAPAGTHTTREGIVVVVDEESTIVEIKKYSEETTEETTEEDMELEEEVVDKIAEIIDELTPESVTPEMAEEIAEKILEEVEVDVEVFKNTVTEILNMMNSMNGKFKTQINSLKKDFENFKNSPERKPVEKKANFKESFDDFKVDFLKELRGR